MGKGRRPLFLAPFIYILVLLEYKKIDCVHMLHSLFLLGSLLESINKVLCRLTMEFMISFSDKGCWFLPNLALVWPYKFLCCI